MKRFFLCLLMLLLCAGCARQAEVSKPLHYKADGLVFDYPGNWTVAENDVMGEGRFILMKEPGSAVFSITVCPPGQNMSLENYADILSENMKTSALGGAVTIGKAERTGGIDALEMKFMVSVGPVKVPHTMNVSRHVLGDTTLFCMSQVADEDRKLVVAGFDLIRGSLAKER